MVISEHNPISVISQTAIKPGTSQFQDNHETHYSTEVTYSYIKVGTNFIITNPLL